MSPRVPRCPQHCHPRCPPVSLQGMGRRGHRVSLGVPSTATPAVSPALSPLSPGPAAMTPYRQELEKYRDIDEDKILQELSPEELAQLDAELAEMDPEVGTGTLRGDLRVTGATRG